MNNILSLFEPIKAFVFDIDGVMTNGTLLVQENGELLRHMNIKDGYALQLAAKKGYGVWVISGGRTEAAKKRLQNLGIKDVYIAVEDKAALLEQLIAGNGLAKAQLLYMGDDMPDLKAMQLCGLPTCPADAVAEVRMAATYISPFNGGTGCVRDVIEKVLKLNGHWE
ncbi:MAG: 3-deoxy-D-manno-octulosonate 8-phosphate phosphatase [Edaphocola sp.]